jgi:hypothetical protein
LVELPGLDNHVQKIGGHDKNDQSLLALLIEIFTGIGEFVRLIVGQFGEARISKAKRIPKCKGPKGDEF